MRGAGLLSRWPRWPVTLALVGVIIVGGASAIAKWPHAWWWLVVLMAAAAAVMPPALAALSQWSQRRQDVERAMRTGLQATTGRGGGKLPTVRTAHLEARVHQTVLPVPYIPRDQEETIRAHLSAKRPVLLIGSSMVGKTKMAARVISEEFGSWRVVIPDSKRALAELDAKDVTPQDSVIWLDDIDRLIGADGITDGALRRLAAAGNVIVGTIRARAYDPFRPSDLSRPLEWDVLGIFEHVFISRDLTQTEQERLAHAVGDPEIRDRICAVGLGEYVGAAGQVAQALKLGAVGTEPVGYALVLAAADWRRCGITRPVPADVLVPLAEPHLDQRGRLRLTDQDAFSSGLAWATREINPKVSLLQPAGDSSYIVYDYALDLISEEGASIPLSSWDVIMANTEASELVDVGQAADRVHQRPDIAIQAFRRALAAGRVTDWTTPEPIADRGFTDESVSWNATGALEFVRLGTPAVGLSPVALLYMGMTLQDRDAEGAKAAYQHAIESEPIVIGPLAALGLGHVLEGQGDAEGAKAAYQKAIDSGATSAAPKASLGLGHVLEGEGNAEGAKAAYQKAIDSGDTDTLARAAFSLGYLLQRAGDAEDAKAAYQKAIHSGDTGLAPKVATLGLGQVLAREGDAEGAKAAYQKAIDSGDTGIARIASLDLGNVLARAGDAEGAKAAYQKAIDSGDTDTLAKAALGLAELLKSERNVEGAKAAYQRIIEACQQASDSGHADANLLVIQIYALQMLGRFDDLLAAHDQLLDLDPDNASAHLAAGYALLYLSRFEDALTASKRALDLDSDNPSAHENLGIALAAIGDLGQALNEFDAADRLRPNGMGEANTWAGAILWHQREPGRARDRFALVKGRVNGCTPFHTAEMEAVALCGLGQPDEAEQHLVAAISMRTEGDKSAPRAIYDLLSDPPIPGIDRLRAIVENA